MKKTVVSIKRFDSDWNPKANYLTLQILLLRVDIIPVLNYYLYCKFTFLALENDSIQNIIKFNMIAY